MRFIDMKDQRFERLTVLSVFSRGPKDIRWLCRCDCGTEKFINGFSLRKGLVKSCGCLKSEMIAARSTKHGKATRKNTASEYNIWSAMLGRCYTPTNTSYKRYGGRGIKVCERWHTFENFYADMGQKPPGTSIGRINGDGNYEPSNCRWETVHEQSNNRKNNRVLEFNGRRETIANWAKLTGIHAGTIGSRLRLLNYSVERALTQPVKRLSSA